MPPDSHGGSLEALHSPQPGPTLNVLETVSLPRQREWLRRYLACQVPPSCYVTKSVTVRSPSMSQPRQSAANHKTDLSR